jgi:hypothetical protein
MQESLQMRRIHGGVIVPEMITWFPFQVFNNFSSIGDVIFCVSIFFLCLPF